MARTSCRKPLLVVPLLSFLLVGAAAAPTAQDLFSRAKQAWSRGNTQETVELAAAALKESGDDDSDLAWRIRLVYADSLISNGRFADGNALLARPLPSMFSGTDLEVLRLRGLAVTSFRLKDLPATETFIRKAYALAPKHPRTLPAVLLVLGTIEKEEAKGNAYLRSAIKYAQQYNDRGNEERAVGALGLRLARADRFDEAIDMLEPALQRARASRNESTIQKYEGNLGWAYLELGDYEVASSYFESALEKAKRLGANFDLVPWTYQLGNIRLQHGDLNGARTYYTAAYERARSMDHDQLSAALLNLANVARLSRRLADAYRYAGMAAEKARNDVEKQRAQLMRDRLLVAEGKYDEAEHSLESLLAAKTTSVQSKTEAYGVLAQVYVGSNEPADAEDAFRTAVRSVRAARSEIHNRELRFAFYTSTTELFDGYVDFLIARGRDEEALEVTETSRAQTLEEGLEDVVPSRDPKSIARETGATILCYWLGGTRSYLWVVTPKSIKAIPLPPRMKIEKMVELYQNRLTNVATGSLERSGPSGIALWSTLIEPAARFIAPESRVIVVPHGRLHAFNFETLVVPLPEPHYWIRDAVISTAGSLGMLARKQMPSGANARLLVVGNPPQPSPEFAKLPKAGDEIRRVEKHFGGRAKVLSEAKATRSAYLAAKPETYEYLHFVAHGVASKLKPLDSAVVLAREGDDYKLYARDIAKQQLHARLVTISSCHGAGTRAYAGEGLVGLGWAFLSAGADNVIAALWNVNDTATPELMDTFYARLVKGATPAIALREAKLQLLRKGGAHAKPFYWAPFLLYGSS